MKLTMIDVVGSEKKEVLGIKPLHCQAHHVKEIFLLLLQEKIDIDGSGKITITCAPRNSEPQYQQILGTSNYFIENFDIKKFNTLSSMEKDELILRMIEDSLIDIANINKRGADIEKNIKNSCRAVRQNSFAYKVRIPKLSKSSPCKRFKANVYRVLSHEFGEAWYVEFNLKDSSYIEWITDKPSYIDRTDFFKKTEWKDDSFLIYDRLNKLVRKSDLSKIIK